MKQLIPSHILSKYGEKKYDGVFDAITMFIDISGFTKITQSLMKKSNEGAEILTDIINNIFTPSIEIIYKYNGYITTFAGDSFTSVFPIGEHKFEDTTRAISSALKIQEEFLKQNKQKTKFGNFKLDVKIGLSVGKINWKILRTNSINEYYYCGEAIRNAALCEKQASAGEILIDEKLYMLSRVISKSKKKGLYKILSTLDKPNLNSKKQNPTQKHTNAFLPKSILKIRYKGEFRNVISCFISFDENTDFDDGIKQIINLSQEYGGYFNKIDISDKGGMILIVFGAPVSHELVYRRACDFAFTVSLITKFKCKIGLSFGMVFAGFIGSSLRSEYTILGMVVNLANRYTLKANWQQIYIDRFIQKNIFQKFETENLGTLNYKGFSEKIQTFRIISKSFESRELEFTNEFIGRTQELQILKNALLSGSNGNLIYVHGNAGIGKSRLIHEIKENKELKYIFLPCDKILRKSFNPFIYYLKKYFEQSDIPDLKNFEYLFDNLIQSQKNKKLQVNLRRAKPFIGSLVGLYWKGSLYEQLDSQYRYENILYGMRTFFIAMSSIAPLLLHIENADKIDEDSKKLLITLSRNPDENLINYVVSCRSNDDGSDFDLNLEDLNTISIDLKNFNKTDSEKLILTRLKVDKIHNDTIDLIHKKSMGNPFFIEQLLDYLIENNILNDKLEIVRTDFEIPTNINSILVAKLDSLNNELQEVIKTASVLGIKFTEKVLSSMMGKEKIKTHITGGINNDIWFSLTSNSHAFQSDLIRDSAYRLILKKDIKELHKLAADSIYDIFKDDLEEHYADLTYNFQQADILDKAIFYLEKAGDYSKEKFQNEAALKYYNKLLQITATIKPIPTQLVQKIKLNVVELMLVIGETEIAHNILIRMTNEELIDNKERDRLYYLQAKYFIIKSDFKALKNYVNEIIDNVKEEYYCFQLQLYHLDSLRFLNEDIEPRAKALLKVFKKKENVEFKGKLMNILGVYYLNKSSYKSAMKCFQINYEIVDSLNNLNLMQMAYHNIGITYFRIGDSVKALQNYQKAFKISEKIGDKNSSSKIMSDVGATYRRNGKYKEAIKFYKRGLEIAKTTSNKMEEGLIQYNIADLYHQIEKFKKSSEILLKSKEICEKISDYVGISYANDLHGDNLFKMNKIKEAEEVYLENLKLQRQIQDIEGIGHTYGNLGNIAKIQKKYNEADNYYNRQQNILKDIGDKEGEGKAYFNWAMIEVERKRDKKAISKLNKAIDLFRECNFKLGYDMAKEQLEILVG